MTPVDAPIKIAIVTALMFSIAIFVTMAIAQFVLKLDEFNFGAKLSYDADTIKALVKQHPEKAALAVVPMLFPYDFLFILAFSTFLMLCSLHYFSTVGFASQSLWLVLILPAIYGIADATENVLLAQILSAGTQSITKGLVTWTHVATAVKWGAALSSAVQTVALFVLAHLAGGPQGSLPS